MAGDSLFGRRCRVTLAIPVSTPGDFSHVTNDVVEINGGDDQGLRVQFKITKSSEKDPNTSEITITNLAETRRASLQSKGVKVRLEAGYVSSGVAQLFIGDARTIDHVRDGADWNTAIKCGDGERSFRWARASESFAAGTSAGDILKWLANQTGLPVGNVPEQAAGGPFASVRFDQGYVVSGSVQRSIDRLVKSLGFTWSIQDAALQVLAPDATLDIAIPEIAPDSGLIGSPEMGTAEKKGKPALLKFKSLLIPTRPGAKVKLRSKRYNGFVKVKKCEFDGDTHGGDWYTSIEGIIVNG